MKKFVCFVVFSGDAEKTIFVNRSLIVALIPLTPKTFQLIVGLGSDVSTYNCRGAAEGFANFLNTEKI